MQSSEIEIFCQRFLKKSNSLKRDQKNCFSVGACHHICVYGLQFEKIFGIMSPIKLKSALGCIKNNHFFTGEILPKSTQILAPPLLLKEILREKLH
jgi:hypothetical protein